MKLAKKLGMATVGVVISLAGVGLPSAAQALVFTFSYSAGAGFLSASGTLTTTDLDPVTNKYTVIGISGTRTLDEGAGPVTSTINSLLAPGTYGGNDNLLNASSPFFSADGISFTVGASNESVNLFYQSSISRYREVTDSLGSVNTTTFVITQQASVPEPSDIGGLAILLGMGGLMVRKFKTSQKTTNFTAEQKKETLVS